MASPTLEEVNASGGNVAYIRGLELICSAWPETKLVISGFKDQTLGTEDGRTLLFKAINLGIDLPNKDGKGNQTLTFALPFVATPNINADGMAGNAFDASASTDFVVFGQIPGGGSLLNFGRNGAGVRAGTPFAWAVGDKLTASLTYLVR